MTEPIDMGWMSLPQEIHDAAAAAQVPKGQRNWTLRETAFAMAREGATNHEILARLSVLSEAMDKYTDANLYQKWTRLLGMVREVRKAGIMPRAEGQWCNCQAIPGTVRYPGPWHPKGDPVGCFRYSREGNCPRCGLRDADPALTLCPPCNVELEAEIAADSADASQSSGVTR